MNNGNIISVDGRIPLSALTRTVTNNITEEDAMLSKTVTLINSQILTSPTVYPELIAAPGVGKVIFPFGAFISSSNIVDYTNIGDRCIISLFWYDGVNTHDARLTEIYNEPGAGSNSATLLLTQDWNFNMGLAPVGTWNSEQAAFPANLNQAPAPENSSFVFYIGNFDSDNFDDLGNLTGGGDGNTIKLTIYYTIVDL